MVKNVTVIDESLHRAFARKYLAAAGLLLSVGASGTVLYALRDVLFEDLRGSEFLALFLLPLALGVLLLIGLVRTLTSVNVRHRVNVYEFREDAVTVSSTPDGADEGTVSVIPYSEITSVKKTSGYVFMMRGAESMPVRVTDMHPEDLEKVKGYLGMR